MSTQIFVNLPVRDLPASKAFFNALGYATNPSFTNDEAACLVISDSIYVMLLVEPFFQGFTRKTLCDARTHTEVLLCLSVASRSEGMRWSPRHCRPAVVSRWKPRITVSCTSAASRISMATCGRSCTWMRPDRLPTDAAGGALK